MRGHGKSDGDQRLLGNLPRRPLFQVAGRVIVLAAQDTPRD
jgi:hypothetical protein